MHVAKKDSFCESLYAIIQRLTLGSINEIDAVGNLCKFWMGTKTFPFVHDLKSPIANKAFLLWVNHILAWW